MATKTSFYMKLRVGLCLCLGMAGSLLAQPALNVTITGTLGPYISGSGGITGAKYVSGITATGTTGEYCLISFNGGTTAATAKVLLSKANTPSVGNIVPTNFLSLGSGYSFTNPPTSATVISGGTASCSGTAVVTSKVDDPLGLNNQPFTAVTTLSPVGVLYNGSSVTYPNLPLTLYAVGNTLPCQAPGATAVVTVNDASDGGNDTLSVSNCNLSGLLTGTFVAKLAFPAGTIPAPVPMTFGATVVTSPLTASSGTYTPTSGTYKNDMTTLAGSGTISVSCSGCPTESLNPAGPLSFTAAAGGSPPAAQSVTVNTSTGANEAFAVTTSTTSGGNWLTATDKGASGGQIGDQVAVSVNQAGLSASGTPYTGTVCVYTAASNSSATSTPCVTVNLTVTPPAFTLQASSLSPFNSVNSTAVLTQNLSVTTSNGSQVAFTASASSTGNWLSVSSGGTTGGAPITVSADPTKVPSPGTYTGSITLTASGATNSPLVINNITLNVTTVPTPAALTFTAPAGGANPPTQLLNVTSAGPAVSYTAAVTSGNSWLSVAPGNGTTNGAAQTVSVNTAGLSANTYNGTITITPSGGAAIPVGVTLTLLPAMQVPPGTSLSFAYTPGSTPAGQTLVVTSSSSTAISYTASTNVTSSGGNWLQVLPASGSTGTTETVSIVTSVASTLPNGSYSGTVVFTCAPTSSCGNTNGQLSVPVTLKVTATLTPAPSSLTFNYTIGASTPASQSIGVTSNGQPITYTATAASGGINWLAVSPGSATTNTGVTASVNGAALTGLGAGSYPGTITLASTGATNNPVVINATLVVSPALGISSNSFAFVYQTGGSTPASQPLTITSNGAALTFTAAAGTTSGGNWLSVSSPAGPTPQTLTVSTVQSVLSTLAANTYNGSITITSAQAGNSPVNIPVTLTVSAQPGLTTAPSSLSFNYAVGGSVPGSQPVTVGGTSPLTGVSASPTVSWISASLSGTATPATMTVSLVQANLPTTAGVYPGLVNINATGAAQVSYPVTLTVTAQPALTVSPLSLAFTGQVGGANPGSHTLSVASNNGSVNFTAAPATISGGAWLSVQPTSGATNAALQVSVNTNGLAVGNYSGSITVTASGATGSPAVIPVSLSVTALANLIAAPNTLSFSYATGSAAPNGQSVAVSTSNSASAAFSLSATTTSGGNWLKFSPASGASPASFVASIVPGGLTAGTYNGAITVSATGFISATVPVTLVVTQPKAAIQVTGSTLFVLANTAAPATSTLAISVSDGSAQAFTIAAGPSQNNWLTLSPTSGTSPANVKLTANPAGLIPGIYVIPITVTMPALPVPTKTIQAQLTITGSNLAASPSMLTFTYQPGLPLPAAQTVSLTVISGGSVALASVTPDIGWLLVSQASSAPAMLQVSVNPGLLSTGTYTGDVIVKGVGSPDASLEIPVTITVNAAPQMTATPATLAFNYQIGGAAPAPQSFAVASGNLQLKFTATSPGNWLQLSPQRGTTPGSVLVTANPAGLPAGTYGGTIKVNASSAASSATVAVTLTVTGPPQISIAPSQLTFTAPVGGPAPAPQTLTVTSASGPLAFTAAAGSLWLGVTPTSGTTPATLTVSVKPAGLANGTYFDTINITQAGSAVPQTIPVTLQVGNVTPTIAGVINAASGAVGTVAPGMAISIFGSLLGPQTGVGFAAPPEGGTVATTLARTEVLFDGTPAPVLFTVNGQVNALAPFELSSKAKTMVQVVYNGVTSAGTTLPVVAAEPGLFTLDGTGKGQGAILNQDGTVNSASHPAAAGSAIVLFGTGGGLTDPPSTDGALNPISSTGALTLKVTATVGGQPAHVFYAGPAPALVSGIFQINLTLPAGTPSGNVPVVVTVACATISPLNCSTASSQTVTAAVQ